MKRPDACMACDRRMRSSHVKKADAPDTVVYSGHGLCASCNKTEATSTAGEPMQLCKWKHTRDGWESEMVSGALVSQTKKFYRLMIDRKIHKYDRPDWDEVIL